MTAGPVPTTSPEPAVFGCVLGEYVARLEPTTEA